MPQSSFSAKLPPKKPHNMTRRSREYLTAEEVDLLIRTARRQGRYGQRNATLILLMYRHALRVAEVVRLQWDILDLKAALVHVRRVKNGVAALHPPPRGGTPRPPSAPPRVCWDGLRVRL